MKCLQPVPLVWAALCLLPTWAQAVACNYSLPPSNPDHIYAVHGDGTVTDTRTSLMWKLCPEGQTYHGGGGSCTGSSTVMTWEQALNAAHNSSFAGHSDWRVPSIKELRSLVEQCRTYPSINEQVFGAASVLNAWSGTPAPTPSALPASWKLAYYVNFQRGLVAGEQRSSQKSVWLVRAGQSLAPVPRLGAVSLAAAPQATSAVVQGHSVQGGTGYWMVVPAGAPAPTAALVQAGAGYGGVSVAQQGSQQMAAGASTTISLTGLAPGTAYDFYAVAEVGGQRSALAHVAFATPAPIDGSCGSASGVASASAPAAASLCSAGTATAVAGNAGQWQWGCTGIDGGTNTAASACTASYASQSLSLSATPAALVVGSASTLAASSTADLPVELSASGPCTLDASTAHATGAGSCTITARQAGTGDSGTLRYLAAADVVLDIPLSPAPVAGQCGSDSGRTDLTAPPAQLCSAGSASTLGGNGSPWSWTCNGLHGGGTHSCSASLQTYAIAASASPPTGGSVQCSPNPAAHGQDVACSASAHAGYRFTAWSGDCSGAAACALTGIQAAHSVQALFARLPALVSLQELAATPTGISMSVVSDSPATAWWLAVAAGSTAPTPAQIKAQPDAYGNPAVTVLAKGSAGPLPAGQATAFEIGALQPGTSYDLYLVVEDGQGALSLPAHVALATPVVDSVPDAFAFAARTGVALSTVVTSEAVTIAGLNSPAAISVEHGEYQIDAGPWSTSPATVEQGQSVRLRHTSSAAYASSSTSTLTIGGVSGSFTSTTQAAAPAPEPEPQEPPPPDPQEPPHQPSCTSPPPAPCSSPSRHGPSSSPRAQGAPRWCCRARAARRWRWR
ncbi:DUF1566 domain-containing protein [Melaminivora jejuensis]|uniref:DUF1566 domain-containing protein n=1 Tax=Melaminivora jejuensis TaxID=1267217 RepID=UPI001ADFD167|nr:DUF1566 domain-containing protein [Melaminivora jejuensis]